MIYIYYKFFDRANEANIYAIQSWRLRSHIQKKELGILHIYGYPLFGKCWSQEYFFNKHVLNSMTQTREKWEKCLTRASFWMVWKCHSIWCFHFISIFSCLEPAVRKNTWVIRRHIEQRHLRDTLQLKILRKSMNIGANFFLFKHHEMKIDKGVWKTTSCTNIQAFTLKNIAPKQNMTFHLSLYASFSIKQT